MKIKVGLVCVYCAFGFLSTAAAQVCESALIKSTYNKLSTDNLDWRVASFVSESDYNEIKHDAGVNAVIYGVPVGASYSDFQKRVQDKLSQYNASLSHQQAVNIMWTGLDPNSAGPYAECLRAQVLSKRGLHLVVKSATQSDISLIASWVPQGKDAATINPKWTGGGRGTKLPAQLQQGETIVVYPRPSQQQTLAVNFSGFGDSVVLNPLPQNPPPPPPLPLVVTNTTNQSGYMNSGACADFSPWYTLCSDNQPPDWKIVADNFQLVGNRSCTTGWAECKKTVSTEAKACYQFRMQGHNEECGHSGNTGIQPSNGVLTVTWQHPQ